MIALQELDLEGDWDPDAHDRQMAGLYGDDETVDDGKPQWDDEIDIGDIPISNDEEPVKTVKKKKKKKKGKEPDSVDQGEGVDVDAMDADVERIEDNEEWDGTEEMRKKKLDEYMEEIYGLDFNDMVRLLLLQGHPY
jgi:protein KRI1